MSISSLKPIDLFLAGYCGAGRNLRAS